MMKFLDKLLFNQTKLNEAGVDVRHKVIFVNHVFLFASIIAFIMGFIRWYNNDLLMGGIDFGFSGISMIMLYYLRNHNEKIELVSSLALIVSFIFICSMYLLATSTPVRLSVFFLLTAAAFFLKGRKQGFLWGMLILLFIILEHLIPYFDTKYSHLDILITSFYLITLLFIFNNYELIKAEQSEALKRLNAHLEEAVEKRTKELQASNESLIASNEQKADALRHLNLIEQEESSINRLNLMLQICETPEETYPRIEVIAQEIFSEVSGGLSIYNHSTQNIETVIEWGDHKILKPSFVPQDCFGIRSGSVNLVNNPKKAILCPHYLSPPQGGYMGIPMFVRNELIGIIHLFAAKEQTITKHVQELAITFANIVKIALLNINLRQSLQELSLRDPLTGLYNRRYITEYLPRELARIERSQTSFIIAMIDIDDFKKFNDLWGHEAGDEVLKMIGHLLNQYFRASDMASRFGGEEFLVSMADADVTQCIHRLEQLCELIKNKTVIFQGHHLPKVTLSIGVALAPQDGTSIDELINAADHALYIAKQSGKDRVEIFQPKATA